jgi:hypothetical protein
MRSKAPVPNMNASVGVEAAPKKKAKTTKKK